MRNKIEKQIHDQVQSYLDEYDFDEEIKRITSKKAVDAEIERVVKEKIARIIEDKFMEAFRKKDRLIDYWANEKLRTLLEQLGLKD